MCASSYQGLRINGTRNYFEKGTKKIMGRKSFVTLYFRLNRDDKLERRHKAIEVGTIVQLKLVDHLFKHLARDHNLYSSWCVLVVKSCKTLKLQKCLFKMRMHRHWNYVPVIFIRFPSKSWTLEIKTYFF